MERGRVALHHALKRAVDHLVAFHGAEPFKSLGDDLRFEVVARPAHVDHLGACALDLRFDQRFHLFALHKPDLRGFAADCRAPITGCEASHLFPYCRAMRRAPLVLKFPGRPLPEDDEPHRDFVFHEGVQLAESPLWLDHNARDGLGFVSSARMETLGRGRRLLLTAPSLALLTRKSRRIEATLSPYGQPFQLGQLRLTLYPAGSLLGSAQLLIERAGRRILYAAAANPRPLRSVRPYAPVKADAIFVSGLYGHPSDRFPPRDTVLNALGRAITQSLEAKSAPVLLTEPLGLAPELLAWLGEQGFRLRLHRTIAEVSRVYAEEGLAQPRFRRFYGSRAKDEVVVMPPILRNHTSVQRLGHLHRFWVTGRALEPGFQSRARVDQLFSMSAEPDFADTLEVVDKSGAEDVYLGPRASPALAEALRERGHRVYSLKPPEQLSLFEP